MDNTHWELITKQLGGEGSREENEEVEKLLLTDPIFKQAYDEALIIWETAPKSYQSTTEERPSTDSQLFNDILLAINSKAEALQNADKHVTISQTPNTNRRKWLISGIAASFILLTGVFFSLRQDTPSNVQPTVTAYSNPKGAKVKTITLPDGSTVLLSAGSHLQLSRFGEVDTQRKVNLTGEAIFDITKNPEKPFIVTTPNTNIKVLGTVFSIQAYDGSQREILTVTEGKVNFASGTESMILTANQSASYLSNAQKFTEITEVTLPANPEAYIAFNDIELSTAVVILENHFDKKIKISGQGLSDRKIYGKFNKENLSEILQAISLALDIQYVVTEEEILLKAK